MKGFKRVTLSEAVEEFIITLQSGTTSRNYRYILKQFIEQTGNISVTELQFEHIFEYYKTTKNRNLSSSTIGTHLSCIKSFVQFLKRRYNVKIDVSDMLYIRPKISQKVPESLEMWEIQALLDTNIDDETRLMIKLLFYCSLRASELLSITIDDVKWDSKGSLFIRVKGKGSKDRIVPVSNIISDELQQAIKAKQKWIEYIQEKNKNKRTGNEISRRLFTISYKTLWHRLKNAGKLAGIKISPHMLRHSRGMDMVAKNVDIRVIAELFGHESLNTTKRYTKVKPELLKNAVNK